MPLAINTKGLWRAHLLALRQEIDAAAYATHAEALCEQAQALAIWSDATYVLGYWPMTARREPDVRPLINWLIGEGKQIVLPVVVNFSRTPGDEPRLHLLPYRGEEALRTNRWGIAEPVGGDPVDPALLDVILVPALGVDHAGYRIGHGFGYYDQLLARTAAQTVCPSYEQTVVEHLPREPHDQRVTYIVTEARVRCVTQS